MPGQLDILALEPFYGGARRAMLETVIRCSRHRWTLLKLPPRRMERRLSAAAHWFAEQLSRHWVGRMDMLFTSEAMNLADLYRLLPDLLKYPAVVYLHDNQLPEPGVETGSSPHDLVNLNTAAAATDLWFNSQYHLRSFAMRGSALTNKYPELSSRKPMDEIARKSRVMYPPTDLRMSSHIEMQNSQTRSRTIFLQTRGADMQLLNQGLDALQRRGEKFELITVGPVEDLTTAVKRQTVVELDDAAQVAGMMASSIYVSAQIGANSDHQALWAMAAQCWPVIPASGVYREMLPGSLQKRCLYDLTPDGLASRIQDAWHLDRPEGAQGAIAAAIRPFEAITACRAMDDRLTEVVEHHRSARLGT